MKRLIKALITCLITGSSLLATQASASPCCATNQCCDLDGCWAVGAELLYWRPCVCDFEYAAVITPKPSSLYPLFEPEFRQNQAIFEKIKPTNHPGWRLFATYYGEGGCRFLTLDWAHVRSTDSGIVVRQYDEKLFVLPAFEERQQLGGQLRAIYNKVNLQFGRMLHRGCALDFYAFAGARLIDLNLYHRTDLYDLVGTKLHPTFSARQKAEYSAFGVELGVGGEYRFECGLGIAGRLGGTAAIGEQKFRQESSPPWGEDFESPIFYRTQTRCVPGIDARLGLNYVKECECVSALLEVGYEINYYYDAVLVSQQDIASTHCENFGFGGPYVSLRFEY